MPRTIYDNHSLFPVTLPPLPLPDTGYDTVDELAEEYVERPIDRLRQRIAFTIVKPAVEKCRSNCDFPSAKALFLDL